MIKIAIFSDFHYKKRMYPVRISDFQKIDVLMGNGILDKIAITCNYVSAK